MDIASEWNLNSLTRHTEQINSNFLRLKRLKKLDA